MRSCYFNHFFKYLRNVDMMSTQSDSKPSRGHIELFYSIFLKINNKLRKYSDHSTEKCVDPYL